MRPPVERFQQSVDLARRQTEELTPRLAGEYAAVLRRAGRKAARRFRVAAISHSLAAAVGDQPQWTAPLVNELVDTILVEQDLLEQTAVTRLKAAEAATKPIMSAMGLSFSLESPIVRDLVARAGVRAAKISIPGLRDAVQAAITEAFADGLSVPQTAGLIESKVDGLASYQSEMLSRTDLIGTANGGSLLAAKIVYPQGDLVKRWVNATDSNTVNDGRIRPTHMEANGQAVPIDGSFVVGGAQMLYPGDPSGPDSEVINCFPGETLVIAPNTEVGFRRWYNGSLVVIETDGFHELAGTPNHPVLTIAGWKRLIDLEEGDDLVCGALREYETPVTPDVDQTPSLIKDVFCSLADARHTGWIAGSRVDFHGDGSEREVEIVASSGLLCGEVVTTIEKPTAQDEFVRTDKVSGLLSPQRLLAHGLLGSFLPTNSIMGRLAKSSALLGASLGHPGIHGRAASSRLDSHSEQPVANHSAADAIEFGERLLGSAIAVSLAQVVKIERRDFAGHVFNLQTESGAYLANGIVSHNCRCTLVYDEPLRDITATVWEESKHPRHERGRREGGRFAPAAETDEEVVEREDVEERARLAKAIRDTVEVDELNYSVVSTAWDEGTPWASAPPDSPSTLT